MTDESTVICPHCKARETDLSRYHIDLRDTDGSQSFRDVTCRECRKGFTVSWYVHVTVQTFPQSTREMFPSLTVTP